MAKRNKKQQQSNRYSLLDCEKRPVTETDKWCQIKKMSSGQKPIGDAPFGYVVTIPYCPNENTFLDDVGGCIVRCKYDGSKILLQVISKRFAPKYGVKSTALNVRGKQNKRRLNRIFCIKNLSKSNGEWGEEIR